MPAFLHSFSLLNDKLLIGFMVFRKVFDCTTLHELFGSFFLLFEYVYIGSGRKICIYFWGELLKLARLFLIFWIMFEARVRRFKAKNKKLERICGNISFNSRNHCYKKMGEYFLDQIIIPTSTFIKYLEFFINLVGGTSLAFEWQA